MSLGYPKPETVVTNIFTNNEDGDSDLLGLLIILSILYSGEEVRYGLTSMERDRLFKLLKDVCVLNSHHKHEEHLSWAVADLTNQGLLRTFNRRVSTTSQEIEVLELMPRAKALWHALRKYIHIN